nr:ATP-binding protein [Methanobrevibacter arboriphilus]
MDLNTTVQAFQYIFSNVYNFIIFIGVIGGAITFLFWIFYGLYSKFFKKKPLSEELKLRFEWFKIQFEKNKNSNIPFFKEELYTETNIDDSLKKVLIDDSFLFSSEKSFNSVKKSFLELKRCNDSLYLEYNNNQIKKALELMDFFINLFNENLDIMKNFIDSLNSKKYGKLESFELENFNKKLTGITNQYHIFYDEFINDKEIDKEPIKEHQRIFFELCDKIKSLIFELEYTRISDLHIFGEAHSGKTYISTNLCNSMINKGKPALFISGKRFTSEKSIESQLKEILGIPNKYTLAELLDELERVAKYHKIKMPIIIDGIHESTNGIGISNIWKNGLKGFIEEIKRRKSLLLITTCRETYKDYIWNDEYPENIEWIQKFHGKFKLKLIKKYFKYYKIKANITNTSYYQFSEPLYLKIFCESKNPERKKEVEVFIGKESIPEIFDQYLELTNKNIIENLDVDLSQNIVEYSLKQIGAYLWTNKSRYVPLDDACKLIDKKSSQELKSKSKIRALQHENLLIFFEMIDGKEEISFVFDWISGYIIAKHLFDTYNNIDNILKSYKVMSCLFSDDYTKLHPYHEDIKRFLAILSISNNNKYLHDVSIDNNVVKVSIESLFEIPPKKITENCVNFTKNYFLGLKNPNFNLFNNSLLVENHPFNSMFLFDLLTSMELTERDLKWTEDVRNNVFDFKKNIEYFEDLCKNNQTSKNTLKLFAHYLIWCLSSVNYMVRDKVTEALYYYGRIFPEDFFELVLKSFDINDPWISERMLASAYGVAMALHYDNNSNFSEEILPVWAKKIYDLIFKENAKYSTTHLLKRDYVKGIIDISLLHHPNLFNTSERERIKPPFTDGGIRNWGESKDRDKGRYRDGNFLIDEISQDDDISKLGPEMDKYQQNDAYRKAKAQILWGVYELGYSLDKFGELDKKIVDRSFRYSNTSLDDEFIEWNYSSKYGYKYVNIALLELAGYRDDLGKLRTDWDEGTHTYLSTLDPSFPADFKNYEIINKDFGVVDNTSKYKWLEQKIPNLKKYLYLKDIDGCKNSWILLDGSFNFQDKDMKKQIYFFPRGFFVHEKDEEEICKFLKTQDLSNRYLPELFENHSIFAGEIPWSEMFAEEEWDEISFENGFEEKEYTIENRILTKNNDLLSEKEKADLYGLLSENERIQLDSQLADVKTDNIVNVKFNVVSEDLLNNLEKYEENKAEVLNSLNRKLTEQNVKITASNETKMKNEPKYETFKILCSVRNYHWEDNNMGIHQNKNVSVPIKQISKSFNLFNQPQTFDLYDENGKASSTVQSFDNYGKSQHFTYLRKDLLDKFLEMNNYKFIMVIWGNKEIFSDDEHPYIEKDVPIKQIVKYNELNSFKL